MKGRPAEETVREERCNEGKERREVEGE